MSCSNYCGAGGTTRPAESGGLGGVGAVGLALGFFLFYGLICHQSGKKKVGV